MRCQVCGYLVTNPEVPFCPNCGSPLPRPAAPSAGQPAPGGMGLAPGQPPTQVPGIFPGIPPGTPPGTSQPGAPLSGPAPETVPSAAPGMPPGYPPPPAGWPAPPGYPPLYGPPTMPPGAMPSAMPPGYGQPTPPSMPYGAPPPGFEQLAPPSVPAGMPLGMPPGMPPGTPYPYPFAAPSTVPLGAPYPGYPGYPPSVPPAPPRKRRTGLIVSVSLAAVLVVLAAAGGALYAFVPQVRAVFSGSSASATPTASVTLEPTATATPSETILYQNTFASAAGDWSNDSHCFLRADGYHAKDGYICYAPIGAQINVDVTVDVKQISGDTNQPYGIALRLNRDTFSRYEFDLDALGHWVFFRCDGNGKACTRLVDYSADASIHGGLNVANTLEVKAKGSHFEFFINGVHAGQADDATYTSGLVGLSDVYTGECVFNNLTIAQPN